MTRLHVRNHSNGDSFYCPGDCLSPKIVLRRCLAKSATPPAPIEIAHTARLKRVSGRCGHQECHLGRRLTQNFAEFPPLCLAVVVPPVRPDSRDCRLCRVRIPTVLAVDEASPSSTVGLAKCVLKALFDP